MKITADTITDEQIREWFLRGLFDADLAHVALNGWPKERIEARARCAEIWNQRSKEGR